MREITFFYPSKSFPALSVTGGECALNCTHCRKLFLQNMIPTPTPGSLGETCLSLWQKNVEGVLVSGGCDAEGRVPLFFDTLGEIRKTTGLILNVHSGFVDEKNLSRLKIANPHYVSFDIPTTHALRNVYGINRRSEDYVQSLFLLKESGFAAVPHVCLGMNEDFVEEREILKRISRISDKVVLTVVFGARGTDFENTRLNSEEIIDIFRFARPLFKTVNLGCMRPRIRKIEEEALILDGIVQPTQWVRRKAQELHLQVREKKTCCVVD